MTRVAWTKTKGDNYGVLIPLNGKPGTFDMALAERPSQGQIKKGKLLGIYFSLQQ